MTLDTIAIIVLAVITSVLSAVVLIQRLLIAEQEVIIVDLDADRHELQDDLAQMRADNSPYDVHLLRGWRPESMDWVQRP